ncbi:hypothetical protein K474DRAFT_1711202 [Panus rudis PR-1116 ss-1]|nr:hypothetical protein K474DRAFT_1711202 [Panus rudis PR-1116 ss-1]
MPRFQSTAHSNSAKAPGWLPPSWSRQRPLWMSILHAYFRARNQQAFRLLDTPPPHAQPRSSGGKSSWNRPSPLLSGEVNVNAREHPGRTSRLLLHRSFRSGINVSLRDYESHWTALHRALDEGNARTATLLLQRTDIDVNLEGYPAFDLYNSTVGTNRNAALGLGDADDRMFPDKVTIERSFTTATDTLDARFEPVYIDKVAMAKLHIESTVMWVWERKTARNGYQRPIHTRTLPISTSVVLNAFSNLVSKQVEKVVLDDKKDIFVEFYASWGEHCKRLKPACDSFGDRYVKVKGRITISAVFLTRRNTAEGRYG